MTGKVLERKKLAVGQRFELTGHEVFVVNGRFE
jgi:hypothetical protein